MKDEDFNNERGSKDFIWKWINKYAGHYHTRQEVSSFLGNERIRVTFSNKIEDKENNKNPLTKTPEKDVNQKDKPEKGDGAGIKKDEPEIRYDIE
jgi:hypothetical protein